jgi:hypothetical protein
MSKQSTKKRSKRNWRVMRFRKGDPAHNLLAATTHWIKANGGTAVVIGGIEVQQWPQDGAYVYRVAIRATGRPPRKAEDKH